MTTITTTATTTTSDHILDHTTAFINEVLSQSELRHRLFSTFRCKIHSDQIIFKPLNLASETLEQAISATIPATRSSSLRIAEKLLLSYPENAFSALLLSLIYTLRHRPIGASLSLLDVFFFDPSSARSEMSPTLFEELFLLHLLPILQWFNDRRSKILSSLTRELSYGRSGSDNSMAISHTMLLSSVSQDQGLQLKELEREYEQVLDENCKAFVGYLKEIVEDRDGVLSISPPQLILTRISEEPKVEEKMKAEIFGLENGRYNPMWSECEDEGSNEYYSSGGTSNTRKSKLSPTYPQRVSPQLLTNQKSTSRRPKPSHSLKSDSDNISNAASSDESEPEIKEKNTKLALFEPNQTKVQKQKQPISSKSSCSDTLMADSDSMSGGGKHTPPKDFVCPITSYLFVDPVTLETGQTYERKAIQEWIDRGNSTCPITRQKLHSNQLPKTNYVLKRLIASWQEMNPGAILMPEIPQRKVDPPDSSKKPSLSPTSVISQATNEGTYSELRLAITNLCMSEILTESETAVLRIERFWREANMESEIQNMLTKPAVVNGFVEILFNSVVPQVLKATVYLLTELGLKDKTVIQTLTRVDSDVDCIVALFKKGLIEASVLIYLLKPSTQCLVEMDMVESLLMVIIKKKEEESAVMCMKPKTAAILLLGQILGGGENMVAPTFAQSLVSAKAIESVVASLKADSLEERIAAVRILLRCMQEDGRCRNVIADKAELAPLLESFMGADDSQRFEIVHFLSELVKLNRSSQELVSSEKLLCLRMDRFNLILGFQIVYNFRRTFNEQLLHIIKDEGAFSTMHMLLVYLQTALQDQIPVVASLLLELDLLAEPRKMSMYREEAIDALISCLRNSEFPGAQISTAETIISLQGRFSASGNSLTRAFLLKRAGLERSYKNLIQKEQLGPVDGKPEENMEEEKAADEWERKMAFVLVSHEFGLLFEALAEGIKSRYAELSSACFVSAAWLTHMLNVLPDTGIRGAARVCLLKQFVSIFKSAKDSEDKALAMLALSSFTHDPDGLRDLTVHMKDMLKGLRELKRYSSLPTEMLKIFSQGQDPGSSDLWNHRELVQVDSSSNGEVLSLACFKDRVYSGHSDGTLKVWSRKGTRMNLIQEVQEHTKGITSLSILNSGEKLYSSSLDRTARIWATGHELIHCLQVHEMKEQIQNMVFASTVSCFVSNCAGVKVHAWNGETRLMNPNKNVKCMSLVQGKLYCGCNDSSIQEIDLATGTTTTIQSGNRKLLVKANPIHAIQVCDGLVYSASSSIDGAAIKIWNASNLSMVASLPSNVEVRNMVVSSELIYLGCKMGIVEIWCKEKHNRLESLRTGTNGKVLCMSVGGDEEVLVIGTSDGRIKAWGRS